MNAGWVYWTIMAWVGVLMAGMSIPFIRRRIPPNALAGFRTPKTTVNKAVWYEANRIMGWDLLWCGVVILLSTGATFLLRTTQPFDRLVLINTFVLLTAMTGMVAHGFWKLSKL